MRDTFLCVWDRAEDYEPQGKALAWVFTIARHLCYMRFRQRRRETELSEWDKEEEGRYTRHWNRRRNVRFCLMLWLP